MDLFVNFRSASRKNVTISYDGQKTVSIVLQKVTTKTPFTIEISGIHDDRIIKSNVVIRGMMLTKISDDYALFEPYDEKLMRFNVSNRADSLLCVILPVDNMDLYVKDDIMVRDTFHDIFDVDCLIGGIKRLIKYGLYVFAFEPMVRYSIELGFAYKTGNYKVKANSMKLRYLVSRKGIEHYPYYEWSYKDIKPIFMRDDNEMEFIKYSELIKPIVDETIKNKNDGGKNDGENVSCNAC